MCVTCVINIRIYVPQILNAIKDKRPFFIYIFISIRLNMIPFVMHTNDASLGRCKIVG